MLIIHVQPGASRTEYVGTHGGALKFRVAAPPVGGAANEALCAYLAEQFGLPKRAIKVSSGRGSRRKRVLLTGVTGPRAREVFPH